MLKSSLLPLQAGPIPLGIWSFYFCLWKRWYFPLSWQHRKQQLAEPQFWGDLWGFLSWPKIFGVSLRNLYLMEPHWTVSKPRETLSTLILVHNLWQSLDLQCNFDIRKRNTMDILCEVGDSPAIHCCCCVPRLLTWRQLDSLLLKSPPKEQSCMTYLAKRWNWGWVHTGE